MYCGSCLRDNALATALKRMGHDVVLIPVYTPTLTDQENVSEDRVFFGGINVYLQQKSSVFRNTPALLDRVLDSNWALRMAAQRSIGVDPKFLGEMTVDMLKGENGPIAKEFRKLADWLRTEPKFDVINLPFTLLIAMAEPLRRASGSRIVCTLQGEDLFLDGLQEPYRTQALELIERQSPVVDRFIAVSRYYADFMAKYLSLDSSKISVASLGISFEDLEPQPKPRRDVFKIGYFARVDPAKGLHNLCEAYRLLRKREGLPKLRLEVAGHLLDEHRGYLAAETAKMEEAGLGGEFAYHGSLSREKKIDFLRDIDINCVPTDYVEPKGLFVLESLAVGTPVVLPAHGAFPEILARTGGGSLVQPGNSQALAVALEQMVHEPERRSRLASEGAENVRKYFSAESMAAAHLEAYS